MRCAPGLFALLGVVLVVIASPVAAIAEPDDACPPAGLAAPVCAPPAAAVAPAKAVADIAVADALAQSKDWLGCARAYSVAYDDDPSGLLAGAALRGAFQCWQRRVFELRYAGPNRGADADLARDRAAMIASMERWMCAVRSAAIEATRAELGELEFVRARSWFEQERWPDAAFAFREIAFGFPDLDVGLFAAQLYLESMNMMGGTRRPACVDAMAADTPKLLELYCAAGSARAEANDEQCGTLRGIERGLELVAVDRIVEAANANPGGVDAASRFTAAAEGYLAIWERFGKAPCERANREACARSEEVLWSAAEAFRSAHDVDRALATWLILLDPKYHLNETELARRAVRKIGEMHRSIASYGDAAAWFERFADASPRDEGAADALADAIGLRLAVGEVERAVSDSETFTKLFGAKRATQAASIELAIATHLLAREDWEGARERLTAAMGRIDKSAAPDVAVGAHARLGRVYAKLGKAKEATAEFEKVRAAWKTGAAVEAIAKDDVGPAQRAARSATLADAVGEAAFYFAEITRAAAPAASLPAYTGVDDLDAVRAAGSAAARAFVTEQSDASAALLRELGAITVASLGTGSEEWVARAAARAFQTKAKVLSSVMGAPIPARWKQRGPSGTPGVRWEDLRVAYYDARLDTVASLRVEVERDARACVALAAELQITNEATRACASWLEANAPSYRPLAELWPAATRVGAPAARPIALEWNGDPAVLPLEFAQR